MAYEEILKCISLPANADLSAAQYHFVTVNSSGNVALTGDGAAADGVLQDKPDASGAIAQVAVSGVSLVEAAEAITAGDLVASNAAGEAVTAATTGDVVLGRALTAASADGALFSVLLTPSHEPVA